MNIFNFKTTKKQIEIFERNVSEILKNDFPGIKKVLELSSKLYSIQFPINPSGISLSHGYSAKNYEKIIREHKTNFDLYGLKLFNKKLNQYEDITLHFHNDFLTFIKVINPEKFHKTYDYCKLQIGELSTKQIYIENLDKKITLKILKKLPQDKLNQLEIEDTFEIEFNDNLYYTILDMEDGNYIALDKSGKVYRLNHDHNERVKEISKNIDDFFSIYKGNKSNLFEIIYN